MKAIILAAGRGSRMKEKTDILPKCLTKLWGKTLLEWQIQAIRRAGIEEIGVITGYHAEQIVQADVKFFHNNNWEHTNMVATLLEADEWLKNDDCVVSYADIVYSEKAIRALLDTKQGIALTYYTKFMELWKNRFDNPLDDIESFKMDKDGILIEIGQKAKALSDIEGQYMGILKFTPSGWIETRRGMQHNMPKPIEKMDMTGLLSHLIHQGVAIKAVPYDELWVEVDSQDDLGLYESWEQSEYACIL